MLLSLLLSVLVIRDFGVFLIMLVLLLVCCLSFLSLMICGISLRLICLGSWW